MGSAKSCRSVGRHQQSRLPQHRVRSVPSSTRRWAKRAREAGSGYLPAGRPIPSRPNVVRTKPRFLIAQPNETGSEHRCRRQQHHRESDLCRNESAAKAMLTTTCAHRSIALFQPFNQIGARTLPCRIAAHGETGQKRQQQGKDQHGPVQPDPALQGDIVARDLWNKIQQSIAPGTIR